MSGCRTSAGSRRARRSARGVPGVAVLMLTVSEDALDVRAALRVGAAGYLLKDMPPGELVAAVLGAGPASRS